MDKSTVTTVVVDANDVVVVVDNPLDDVAVEVVKLSIQKESITIMK